MASNQNNRKIPKSVFGRATRLLSAGATIVGREAIDRLGGGKDATLRVKQATDLVKALSQMKGAAMKAGQLLSLEMSDLLPPEVTQVLRKLHDDATHMPFKEVEKILRQELGPRLEDLKDLSREPVASASIGQVHTAFIDGKKVAIKIQYPGVAESIDSDINLLRRVIDSFISLRGKQASFDGVFDELRESLHLEVDYLCEASSLETYKGAMGDKPGFRIPDVFEQYSSQRVLTLSYEEGERIHSFLQNPLTETVRNRFADLVLTLLFVEFFELGLVQTDPNYGNFLVDEQAKALVLLDFGATKSFPEDFRARVINLLRLAFDNDREALLSHAERFDLLDPRESNEVKEQFCELMETVIYMFRPEVQPFDFADAEYLAEIREVTMKFANAAQFTAPARHMVFLNRKLGGMYHLLKDAGCVMNLTPYWERVMNLTIESKQTPDAS